MSADVEQEPFIIRGAADAADVNGIVLEDEHVATIFSQSVTCGESSGTGPDNERFANVVHVSPEMSRPALAAFLTCGALPPRLGLNMNGGG
jgi:hypothetical protein